MAVRLRLRRVGARKDPVWRVVVADQRSPRDGRVIETIGHYNPQTAPSTVVVDEQRARFWLERGAQATPAVRRLLRIATAPGGAPAPAPAQPGEQASDDASAGASTHEPAPASEVAAAADAGPGAAGSGGDAAAGEAEQPGAAAKAESEEGGR